MAEQVWGYGDDGWEILVAEDEADARAKAAQTGTQVWMYEIDDEGQGSPWALAE